MDVTFKRWLSPILTLVPLAAGCAQSRSLSRQGADMDPGIKGAEAARVAGAIKGPNAAASPTAGPTTGERPGLADRQPSAATAATPAFAAQTARPTAGSNSQTNPPPPAPIPSQLTSGQPQAAPPTTLASVPPGDPLAAVRTILNLSISFLEANDKYTCRLTRQERVGTRVLEPEIMQMDFRTQPRSVHYKWLDKANAGRECVFVAGANDGKIVTLGGKGDFLFVGRQMRVDPNGILARGKSRYTINESGLDNMVRRLEGVLAQVEKGNRSQGNFEYKGITSRQDLEMPAATVVQQMPVGADPAFPAGGIRHWYFDPQTGRLLLMHAEDLKGGFIEYYRFDRFVANPTLSDRDFDPDVLWPSKQTAEGNRPSGKVAGRAGAVPK